LEYDEVKLLSGLGHDVFSTGTYACPWYRPGMIRPGIDSLTHHPDLESLASTIVSSGYEIPDELIDWADTIIFMHLPEALQKNMAKFKGKRVIYRSIGQSVGHLELMLSTFRSAGVEVIRYSPNEGNLPNYAGADAMIRFYKDPADFKPWTGEIVRVVNFTQSMTQRAPYVQKSEMMRSTRGIDRMFYGVGNEDLGIEWGGKPDYDQMLSILSQNRAYIYGGTWPASYTLSFIEAFMSGIPIAAVGSNLFDKVGHFPNVYEIPNIIENGVTGYVSDKTYDINTFLRKVMDDIGLATAISRSARARAIDLFGIVTIRNQWEEFLK
jgi:glycosyltransferase involved in cell wall biosynthesis